MKFLALVAIFVLSFLSLDSNKPTIPAPKEYEAQHATTHRLGIETILETGHCSATAVGPHTLLTAGHCLVASNTVTVDNNRMLVTHFEFDGADHMLLTVTGTFKDYAAIDQRDALPSENVHMWGNPGRENDVYRQGVFEKATTNEDGPTLEMFLLPIFPGDSGSALFSESGKIIGVVSLGDESSHTVCFELQFTSAQLASIK